MSPFHGEGRVGAVGEWRSNRNGTKPGRLLFAGAEFMDDGERIEPCSQLLIVDAVVAVPLEVGCSPSDGDGDGFAGRKLRKVLQAVHFTVDRPLRTLVELLRPSEVPVFGPNLRRPDR